MSLKQMKIKFETKDKIESQHIHCTFTYCILKYFCCQNLFSVLLTHFACVTYIYILWWTFLRIWMFYTSSFKSSVTLPLHHQNGYHSTMATGLFHQDCFAERFDSNFFKQLFTKPEAGIYFFLFVLSISFAFRERSQPGFMNLKIFRSFPKFQP